MSEDSAIARLSGAEIEAAFPSLVALLRDAVDGGASVGYLAPLGEDEARAFWVDVAADVARGSRILLVARDGEAIIGTIQLGLVQKPNGRHRAEVQKLLVLSSARRQGLGRRLMLAIEDEARLQRRSLVVLDTLQGSDAERLYRTLGYSEAGVIPYFARCDDGELYPTVVFYKWLG